MRTASAPVEARVDVDVDVGVDVGVDRRDLLTRTASRWRAGGRGRPRSLVDPGLRLLVGVLAVAAIATYVVVALVRLRSTGELEWMEGGMVQEVRRVLDGHGLYGPPTLTATPYLYTPLYTLVGAAASWVVGPGVEPLRAVSIVSSLVAFWATSRLVVVETRDRWAGLVAAGLLAASYVICGAWFDVARVDSLMLALLLVGLVVARTATDVRAGVAAGTLMVLAVLTKQDAIIPAVACIPFLLRRDRRTGTAYIATLVGGLALVVGVLQLTSGGWFLYYVVDVPAGHRLIPAEYLGFFTSDLRPFLWSGAVVAVGIVVGLRQPPRRGLEGGPGSTVAGRWFVGPVFVGLVAAGWLGRVHSGGWDNVLMPAVVGIVVVTGVAVAVVRRHADHRVAALCSLLLVAQFIGLRWSPSDQLPTSSSRTGTAEAIREIRDLPGPVYLPGHPELLALAGRPAGAQSAALADVLRGPPGAARTALERELEAAVHDRRFASVVVESHRQLSYLPKDFAAYYRFDRELLPHGNRILPVTGFATRPAQVWVPRS